MIIFLYGADTFRSRRKLGELKDKFLREVDPTGSGLNIIDGEAAELRNLGEAISPSSLFARKRMVIIERLFASKKEGIFDKLIEYLDGLKSDDNIIIFWEEVSSDEKHTKGKGKLFKFLSAQKIVQEFKTYSNTEAAAWTRHEAEARGGKISGQAATTLVSLVGVDLWRISSELDKLIGYKLESKPSLKGVPAPPVQIEAAEVEEMVKGTLDSNIFALTDAIGSKNKALALKLMDQELEAGTAEMQLLNMIERQFKNLLQIRQAIDSGLTARQIATTIGLHPYVAQKGISQVRNFTLDILKKIVSRLVEMDRDVKSGKGDLTTALSLLIAKL